jgi:molybdopterin converting factor small subunit
MHQWCYPVSFLLIPMTMTMQPHTDSEEPEHSLISTCLVAMKTRKEGEFVSDLEDDAGSYHSDNNSDNNDNNNNNSNNNKPRNNNKNDNIGDDVQIAFPNTSGGN